MADSLTIGILGGGQLGRMLAQSAQRLGFKVHIFAPETNSPALHVTPYRTIAAYNDEDALGQFAQQCDIITYEFENVPLRAAALLSDQKPVFPEPKALEVGQDRIAERRFLVARQVPTTPHQIVSNADDMARAAGELGLPFILKTTRLGYDGKGQIRIENLDEAHKVLGQWDPPLMAEKLIDFDSEISVIVARDQKGCAATYDPALNVHKNHILNTSTVPCPLPVPLLETAQQIAVKIAQTLDYVGVLGVEFFVIKQDGQYQLMVNELAPRVHNSGHWTLDGCSHSQFDQHIRAITGLPLASTKRHADVVMHNLIGKDMQDWRTHLAKGGHVHLYGKTKICEGRKMGHVNYLK